MKEKNDTISKRRANYIVSHYYPVVKKDPGQGSKEVYVNLEVDFYSRTYNITSKNSSNDKFNFTNNSLNFKKCAFNSLLKIIGSPSSFK